MPVHQLVRCQCYKTIFVRNLRIFVMLLALPAIIKLGWKGLLGTNTIASTKIRKLITQKVL